ncbi:MAG: hypothetical protein H0U73_03755 [Tatlockia sp.]|nr:hypothetical protein [Tatlockia sp.]
MKAKKTQDMQPLAIVKRPEINLTTLEQNHIKYSLAFLEIRCDPLSHTKLVDGQVYISKHSIELDFAIHNDLESSLDRIETLFQKDTVCNKSLILHFKMMHLCACYADYFGKKKTAFQLFSSAYEFIKMYGDQLYKEDDSAFHEQIYYLIVYFSTRSSTEVKDSETIQLIQNEVLPHLIAFTVKFCRHQYSTNITNYIRMQALKEPWPKSEQLKLGLEIELNLKYTSSLVINLNEKGHCNNEFLLLHLSIMILHGEFAQYIHKKEDAVISFLKAFYSLKDNIKILEFEANFAFQEQIRRLFEQLHTFNETEINDIYPELESLETAFTKKCGISIVVVGKAYNKFMKLLWQNPAPLINERKDFFSKATQLNNSFQNLKISNRLPLEYQLYSLVVNYYMLNLSIVTQRQRLFDVLYVEAITIYYVNSSKLNVETLNSYLGSWSNLKKLYIEPSLALIRGMDMSEFVSINTLRYCLNVLKFWSSIFSAIMDLIKTFIDREFKNFEQVQKINDNDQQELMKLVFKLQPEIQFLMNTAELIGKANREINAKIEVKELKDRVTIPRQVKSMRFKSKIINSKVESLKEKLGKLEEQCKTSQDKLINAEKQHKVLQPIKKPRKQIPIQEYAVEDNSSDEDSTTEEEDHRPIDPSLGMLQAVDEELSNRIKKIQQELTKFCIYLEVRLKHKIPLPGGEHAKAYNSIIELTLQSHELDQLLNKYKALAQLDDIKSLLKEQNCIKINQGEHDQGINTIAAELAKIKNLYDRVNFKHEDGKLNKIYEYGLEKIKLKNTKFNILECGLKQKKLQDPNFTIYEYELEQKKWQYPDKIYKRIMELGCIKFKQVGVEKIDKGDQLSQYSNQNKFLGSVDIVFTSLDYLHDKLKKNSMVSNKHAFFNKEKICAGRFEGAIGLLYKTKYQLTGDLNCVYKSIIHLDKSFIYYQKRIDSERILANLSYHLARVKEELVNQDSENSNLITEILEHYQASLDFNSQAKSSRPDDKKIELKIKIRIEALQNNLGNLIRI